MITITYPWQVKDSLLLLLTSPSQAMQDIKTFVYFDIEATGLKSSGRPRVCEMSLIAVNSSDILDLHKTLMNSLSEKTKEDTPIQVESFYPRIINKLTLCVYPMATIVPCVSSMTGLDNYNLSEQSLFDENIGNLLNIFLSCLPSPVSLVAHNGNHYDFPLLKAEMEKAGKQLGTQILCVDSYVGIKEILKNREQKIRVESEIKTVSDLANAGEFDIEMKEGMCTKIKSNLKSKSVKAISSCNVKPCQRKWQHQESKLSISDLPISRVLKKDNETTPSRSITLLYPKCRPKKLKEMSNTDKLISRKKLDFSEFSMPTSFSLINLHKHLLGCPPSKSHGAEADCLALLRITAMLGSDWLEWAMNNCTQIGKCKVMWSMPGKSRI